MIADAVALTAMDDFLSYCDRCAPGFSSAVVAASTEDILRIRELSRDALPAEYRAFLLRMGRTMPGSVSPFFGDIDFGIDAVEQFYLDPPVPVPPETVFLWTSGGDCEMFLGTSGRWEFNHPVLSFSWPPTDAERDQSVVNQPSSFIVSGSLFAFLYREAFRKLRRAGLQERFELRENAATHERTEEDVAQRRARFSEVVERLGFRPLPYLDPDSLLYDSDDAAVSLNSSVLAEDIISVYASDPIEARHIAEILADNLDARLFG